MTQATHHIPESLIRAYVAGTLPHGFAMVVAAHVSMCDDCRAQLEAEEIVGGTVLEALPVKPDATAHDRLRDRLMEQLESLPAESISADSTPSDTVQRDGVYPGPVAQALGGKPPRWRRLGAGIKQSILHSDDDGSVRLLWISPGAAVPDHSHGGLELTLVLQGSFRDEDSVFEVGDVEVADDSVDHTPIAGSDAPCICLAATDAPLKFNALIPRLLQPLFRI